MWGFLLWCHVFFVCNYQNKNQFFKSIIFPSFQDLNPYKCQNTAFLLVDIHFCIYFNALSCWEKETFKLGSSLVEKIKEIGLLTLQIIWLRLYMLAFFFFVTIEKAMLADCFISPGGSPKRLPCHYYITEAGLKQRDFPENISIAAHFFLVHIDYSFLNRQGVDFW